MLLKILDQLLVPSLVGSRQERALSQFTGPDVVQALSLALVGHLRRLVDRDALLIELHPPDVAALVQAHTSSLLSQVLTREPRLTATTITLEQWVGDGHNQIHNSGSRDATKSGTARWGGRCQCRSSGRASRGQRVDSVARVGQRAAILSSTR